MDKLNMSEKSQSFANQVATFLRSPISRKYELDIYHRMILRVIASYLDMPYGSCFAKQVKLAEECGMSVIEMKRKSKQLVDKDLLKRTKCGKLYHYELPTLRYLGDT
jgi:DNA-binding MarR family transcriptional regulator